MEIFYSLTMTVTELSSSLPPSWRRSEEERADVRKQTGPSDGFDQRKGLLPPPPSGPLSLRRAGKHMVSRPSGVSGDRDTWQNKRSRQLDLKIRRSGGGGL